MRKNFACHLRVVVGTMVALVLGLAVSASADALLIDDFEEGTANLLGGRANTYVMAPSRALAIRTDRQAYEGEKALMLKYDKKNEGGPYGSGGWCGYYTTLKTGPKYHDASDKEAIVFWIKGAKGEENFMLGVADRHWDETGDSVKSQGVGSYLPDGKVTTEWQKATVPLSAFVVDKKELASISFCFEGSAFPEGAGRGTVYIDNITLE